MHLTDVLFFCFMAFTIGYFTGWLHEYNYRKKKK